MKLPLDNTDDDISINMGSGKKGGSWKYSKYKQGSNIPTTIPKDDEKPCEHVSTVFNTYEWTKVTEEDGKELEVQVQQVQKVQEVQKVQVQQVQGAQQVQQVQKVRTQQVQQTQQVQPQCSHSDPKDDEKANITTTLIWLVNLWRPHCRNKETLHRARELMNNFLRAVPQVPRDKLQLVGITCLYMSCRDLESSWIPFKLLETLTNLTDDAVTREEVLKLITASGELDGRPIPPEEF